MENESKALLIAAGALLAIMVVSLLAFFYNKLVDYEHSKQITMTEEQIVKFNKEYEAYNRDNVTGYEMVSLLNKILSYNAINTVSSSSSDWGNNNSEDAWTEMYIQFTVKDSDIIELLKKYGGNANGKYDSQKKNDKKVLKDTKEAMINLEIKYGSKVMNSLAALSSYDKDTDKNNPEVKRILGKTKDGETIIASELPENDELKAYQNYIRFKRANFRCTNTEYDNNSGRIVKLIFEEK